MFKVQIRLSLMLLATVCLLAASGCDDAAVDGGGPVSGQALLAAGAPLELVPSDNYPQYAMPPIVIGQYYSATMTATGGSGSGHVWSLISGVLPHGLTLSQGSPSATVSGMPIIHGGGPSLNQICKFRVVDSAGNNSERIVYFAGYYAQTFITVSTTMLPFATAHADYEGFVLGWGGSLAGYQWSVSAGALPPGLSLVDGSSLTGRVVGTPTVPGDYQFELTLTDAVGRTATRLASIKVVPPTKRIAVYSPNANAAQPHTLTFWFGAAQVYPAYARIFALGGDGGIVSWQVVNGNLPPDMHFIFSSNAADLVGEFNLSQVGTSYPFTLRLTDSAGTSIDIDLTIRFSMLPPPPGPTGGAGNGNSTTVASQLVAQCPYCGCPMHDPLPPVAFPVPPIAFMRDLAAIDDETGCFIE